MSDRFRKMMDKRAGRGGVKCYCCGLDKAGQRAVRKNLKDETRREADEELYNRIVELSKKISKIDSSKTNWIKIPTVLSREAKEFWRVK